MKVISVTLELSVSDDASMDEVLNSITVDEYGQIAEVISVDAFVRKEEDAE